MKAFQTSASPKTFHLHFSFLPISHKELFGDKVPIIFVSFPPFPHQGRWTGGAMSIPSWKITILAFYRGEQDFLLDFFSQRLSTGFSRDSDLLSSRGLMRWIILSSTLRKRGKYTLICSRQSAKFLSISQLSKWAFFTSVTRQRLRHS